MALILSSAARLKPEIRLAEAVSQFEASLSREDKASFSDQRAEALKTPPDTMDVMRFTAQIDRRLSGNAGRCLGPRFTNFLSSVQQFAALGDVIIGGSQNIIACGIWSLVRMSILAIVQFSTYLEKISAVFMEIGRSTPRHQQLALVYSRSQTLQAHILEYYIVVVQFCHNIVNITQKSRFRQFTSTLSDATIKSTQSDLDSRARYIEKEIGVLVAKRVEEEAEENSRFRSLSKKFSRTLAQQQEIAIKLRILDRCSSHDHETIWKQIRKIGNTTLFTHATEYTDWRAQKISCTIVYLGKLGCGKSVTMANIIDDLILFAKEGIYHLVYFFIQYNYPTSSQARTIIGSIARQLLRSRHQFTSLVEDTGGDLDIEEMVALLKSHFTSRDYTFLVLDGLDVCSPSARNEVISFIRQLHKFTTIMTCISYRQEPAVKIERTIQALPAVKILSFPDNSEDIEAFIDSELSRRLANGSLILGDASLILEIQDVLVRDSKGMFLWVALQIDAICMLQTDAEIRAALANLPQDLSDVYTQLLRKQDVPPNMYRKSLFEIIMAAQRPLTTHEIREAVSVTRGDPVWTMAKLINDVYSALATCGCLVVVDEEEQTVQFVHPTVERFLLDRFNDSDGGNLTIESCHTTMAEIIVTYLNYQIFGTDVSTYRVPKIKVGSTPGKIITSTVGSSANAQSLALKLLKLRKSSDFDIGKALAQHVSHDRQPVAFDYRFHFYGRSFCVEHMAKALQLSPIISRLSTKLIVEGSRLSTDKLNFQGAMTAATEENNVEMIRHLFNMRGEHSTECNMLCTMDLMTSLISRAICKGHAETVELFAEMDYTDSAPNLHNIAMYHQRPCYFAYLGRFDSFVLDENKVKCSEHLCESGRTVLACAIWGSRPHGFENMLRLLPEIDINWGSPGRTPIWEAVRCGNSRAVDAIYRTGRLKLQSGERAALVAEAEKLGFEHMIDLLDPVEPYSGHSNRVLAAELSDSD